MTTPFINPVASAARSAQAIQLAMACRILHANGQNDFNQGQVSSRLRGAALFRTKRALSAFEGATPQDMIECAVDGSLRAPADAPPELPLHQAIYTARPDVGAIVHTHAEHSLVFGATDLVIKPISHEGSYFPEPIPRFSQTSQTILDPHTGQAVANALGNHSAIFLCNHGVVIVGKTIRQATVLALMLERACKLQLLAESLRLDYRTSVTHELKQKRDYIYSDVALKSYWDTCVSSISLHWPDTASWS